MIRLCLKRSLWIYGGEWRKWNQSQIRGLMQLSKSSWADILSWKKTQRTKKISEMETCVQVICWEDFPSQ